MPKGIYKQKPIGFVGKKHSEETKNKLSIALRGRISPMKGRIHSEETRKKMRDAHKGEKHHLYGKHHSEETKRKMSDAHKGEKSYHYGKTLSVEHKKKISNSLLGNKRSLGYKHSFETCKKRSAIAMGNQNCLGRMGEKANNWKGGITPKNKFIRSSVEFRLWREVVFARDNWTCQDCGNKGGKLHPHHIKSFSRYPELRFVTGNGLTLCKQCHKKTDNYAGKGEDKLEKQAVEFILSLDNREKNG